MNVLRIRSLGMLSVFVLLSSMAVYSHGEDTATYTGVKTCKICHNKASEGKQYTVWKAMKHANAFGALSSERALAIGKERGMEKSPSESAECLRCHVTGYDVEKKAAPTKISMKNGVQCESCHGPASGHVADGPILKKGPGHGLDVLAKIVRPDKNTCLKCHNDENPTWDPAKYTLSNGDTVGFDFDQAFAKIAHSNPQKKK